MNRLWLVFFALQLFSCREEDFKLTIESVVPAKGTFDTRVTITGSNFDTAPGSNEVFFNQIKGQLVSTTSTTIIVKVPMGAGSGSITIRTHGKTFEGPAFEYQLTAVVTTFAGSQGFGFKDGPGSVAKFNAPQGLAFDAEDNLFVCDYFNNAIRKITPEGTVSTFAGQTAPGWSDGKGTEARFTWPTDVKIRPNGEILVSHLHGIRKIDKQSNVTTLVGGSSGIGYADGPAAVAKFERIKSMCLDPQGNLIVTDNQNNRIRKVTPEGVVTTLAGTGETGNTNGVLLSSSFNIPYGIAMDANGNFIVSDAGNAIIRIISPNKVNTLAGFGVEGLKDGSSITAQFYGPKGVVVDKGGNVLVADSFNHVIRMINPTGEVMTIIGTGSWGNADGNGTAAKLNEPHSLAINSKGEMFISERSNCVIRKVTFK